MNSYNNYSQPLLISDDFMNYLYLLKRIFPQQWEFLATTRGICSRDGNDLQDYKERQIFMVLLNLQQLANFQTLKHWTMVILAAYYGWGAKDIVTHITLFLGITLTRTTRDSFFKMLTLNRIELFCSLLATSCSSLIQQSCKRFLAVGPKAKSLWLVFAGRTGRRRGEIAELKPSHSPPN